VNVTPRPRFTPGERTPDTHCTGGWVGPRAGLDTEARGKISCFYRGSNLDRPVVQPVATHYTDWATRLTKYFATCYFSLCGLQLTIWRERTWHLQKVMLACLSLQPVGSRWNIQSHCWCVVQSYLVITCKPPTGLCKQLIDLLSYEESRLYQTLRHST
jgi:hypothetical protein